MDQKTLFALSVLGTLEATKFQKSSKQCKICSCAAPPFDIVDFNKVCSEVEYYMNGLSGITVVYHRCPQCGFLFTPFFDDWTAAEFTRFVYNADYIKVDNEYAEVRPNRIADSISQIIARTPMPRILDYGSGTGKFASRLAVHGIPNAVSYDPFSNPTRPNGRFDLVTCFEAIEHSPTPLETLAEMRSFLTPDGMILIGTGIQPENIGILRANWWYVAPRNGHCSIFTHDALALLGQSVGLSLYTFGSWLAFRPSEALLKPWKFLGRAPDPYFVAVLRAPADGAQTGWHPREAGNAGTFRWTALDRVYWDTGIRPGVPAKLKVIIPYLMEIILGYVSKCEIIISGENYPLAIKGKTLTTTIQVKSDFDGKIELRMPKPITPSELNRGTDGRSLGIAVSI